MPRRDDPSLDNASKDVPDELLAAPPQVAPPIDHDGPRDGELLKNPPLARPPVDHGGRRDDELLADPPQGEHHLGRLAGYRAGRRVRMILLACLGVLFVGVTAAWVWWVRLPEPPPTVQRYELPAGTDISDRPRVMTWSEGRAQLGISRQPPGVEAVELPDRTLRLADGADAARFKVDVESGKTTAIKVESGAIVEELKPGAAPLLK